MTKPRSCSTSADALVRSAVGFAFALAVLTASRAASAQACCATPSAFAPARLRTGERALVGLVTSGSWVSGSFGRDRSFALPGPGATEVDLGQRLFLGWAPFPRAELSFTLPFVETTRSAGGASEVSGGVGDARLASRVTLIRVGEDRIVPGVQLLSAITVPSGVAADAARLPLATDATGTGAFQLESGLALEQSFGRFLLNLTGSVAWRSVRNVGPTSSQLGPLLSGFVALSYTLPNALSFALSAAYEASFDARLGGVTQSDTATAKSTLGVSLAMPITKGIRLTAGLAWTPHVSGLGKNELATFGGSLGVVYAWGGPRACPMHPGAASCDCAQ